MTSEAIPIRPPARIRPLPDVRTLLAASLVALLYVRLVWFVLRNVVDTPFMDEWYIWSELLRVIDDGTLSWEFVVSPYNGHRLAGLRLLLLALLPTRWTAYPQALFTLGVTALFMGVLWRQYRTTAASVGAHVDPWAAVVLASLVFSCADINRLWGMGSVWHVSVLASTVCLLLLSAKTFRWWSVSAAALSATVACFSVAPGLLAWILGLPVLWLATAKTTVRGRVSICWAVAATAAVTLYAYNLPELGSSSRPAWTIARTVDSARFVVTYVGLPILVRFDARLFLAAGLISLVLSLVGYAWLWRHRPFFLRPFLPWIALAAFSVGTGAMIGVARYPLIVAVYYVTAARLFWISALGVLSLMLAQTSDDRSDSRRRWRRWSVPFIAVLLVGVEYRQARLMQQMWHPVREALLRSAFDVPDVCAGNWDAISRLTYPPGALRSQYPILARHGTAFTSGVALASLQLAPGTGFGAIVRAVVEAAPPDGGPPCVRLSGWAVDPGSGEPAAEVVLVQDGKVIKRGAVSQATAEPTSSFGQPTQRPNTWEIFVSQQRWPRGSSPLSVYAVSRDRRRAYRLDLAGGVQFPVTDPGR